MYPFDAEKSVQLLNFLATRGRDAAGYVLVDPDRGVVSHVCGTLSHVRTMLSRERSGDVIALLHCRARPLTEEANVAQPVIWRNVVVAMQGIVENDQQFKEPDAPTPWIDAYVFCKVFETDDIQRIVSSLESVLGSFSAVCINLRRSNILHIVKGSQPLAISIDNNYIVVASEPWMIYKLGFKNVEIPDPGTYIRVNVQDIVVDKISFKLSTSAPVPEPAGDRAIVLCSGGLDSGVVAYIAHKRHREIYLLFIDYGQPAAAREREAVYKIAQKINAKVIEVKLPTFLNVEGLCTKVAGVEAAETQRRWVPARNLLLLAVAVAMAEQIGAEYVYTGFNLEESCVFPDNTTEAVQLLDKAAKLFVSHGKVKIVAPLARLMKKQIVKLALDYGLLDITYSCDRPDGPCGECEGCWLRKKALEELSKSRRDSTSITQ